MLVNKSRKSAGFTFTELLVALTINTLLLAALITIFLANLDHYHRAMNTTRLNQQLQSALDIMTSDIRRAGYWVNANNDIRLDQNTNPFMAVATDITTNVANNCILFSYDHDSNGTLSTISSASDDEHYGYRLNNQALQTRPPGATFSCTAPSSEWENMTDPNFVTITNLVFTLTTSTITTGPGTKGVRLRNVDISITGQLASDATVIKTLTQHVKVRNDKFIP